MQKTVDVQLDISLTRNLTQGMRGVRAPRTRSRVSYSILARVHVFLSGIDTILKCFWTVVITSLE